MGDPPFPRVLTTAGAARLGLTEAQIRTELRRGRWRRLAAGVLLTRPDEPSRHDWINVGMALGGPSATLSGWDAVRLRGLGSARPPAEHVLVLTRAGHNRVVGGLRLRPSRRDLSSTQLSAFDDHLPAVRLAGVARAVADTSADHVHLAPVRAMVTAAVQRGLCSPSELAAELRSAPRNGSGLLRRALVDVVGGARSIAEAEAADLLRSVGLSSFTMNAPIHDAGGRLLYRVDFLWPELRAVVEIDSREFHFGEAEWQATMQRHNVLTAMGYAVTHYPPSVVRARGRAWAREIAEWLTRRATAVGA
jgi:very-short-patch-repair endonuclease